ncbi:WXG100 family type VII secretion target [Kitasatospora sp. NPDC127116]|uniref:WXG100 family type VII secretion target n=1 Tax=Kitasatospora sp. NPDC127116 TaxID=3345367 RepID=UPI00363F4DC3
MSAPTPPAPDWSGLGFNPTPGDSAAVTALSAGLRRVGQHLTGVHTTLSQLSSNQGEWTGEAAKQFAKQFDKLPGYLQDAADSITAAYTALDVWYKALTEHQPKAAELAASAVAAKKKKDEADRAHSAAAAAPDLQLAGRHYSDDASLAAAEQRYNTAKSHLDSAAGLLTSASNELAGLQKQAHELAGTHQSDAKKTAEAVRKAADSKAPPEPGWLSKVGDWFKNHGADLLTVAAGVCGVAAIFFPAFALPALLLSAAAAGAHATQYAAKGQLWPPQKNIGNWLTLGGDVLGAIPGVGVAAKGVTAVREARAAGAGVRGAVSAGSTEVRTAARGIDPANPLFTTAIEKPAIKLGVSKATAMNVSDGVQAATTAGLNAPTAYALTQDNPSDNLAGAVNYTTGGNSVIGSAGMAAGGGKANVIIGSVSTVGNLLGMGGWAAGYGR